MIIVPNYKITDHFQYSELACRHCGELIIDELLYRHMSMLESLRQECGFVIIVDSGHRCIKHNKYVGGAVRSMHLKFASDIRPMRSINDTDATLEVKLHTLKLQALAHGFTGIGTYDMFLHLDCRPEKVMWDG